MSSCVGSRRYWMRVGRSFVVMEETYFHMSVSALPEGTKLESRGFPFVAKEVEHILESVRPKTCLPREASVFVTLNEDACTNGVTYDEGYLHTVRPIGPVHRRDLKWLRQLQLRHYRDTHDLGIVDRAKVNVLLGKKYTALSHEEIARRYWAGEGSDNPDWEFVVASAEVTACLSEKPVRFRSKSGA